MAKKRKNNGTGVSKGVTHRIVTVQYPQVSLPYLHPTTTGKFRSTRKVARSPAMVPPTRKHARTHILQARKRVALGDLSKRTITRPVHKDESRNIKQKRVAPLLSRLSPFSCRKKRAMSRRSYLSMRAAGKGSGRRYAKSNRFTVRC